MGLPAGSGAQSGHKSHPLDIIDLEAIDQDTIEGPNYHKAGKRLCLTICCQVAILLVVIPATFPATIPFLSLVPSKAFS
jgi:hypothetical protein